MEYISDNKKYLVKNSAFPPVGNVRLTGGRLKTVFDNNIAFLKKFDLDRMMYWFRVSAGKPATGAPYGFGNGHFENNLYGQTAGMFLMSAGTALLWREDKKLRDTVNLIVEEIVKSNVGKTGTCRVRRSGETRGERGRSCPVKSMG